MDLTRSATVADPMGEVLVLLKHKSEDELSKAEIQSWVITQHHDAMKVLTTDPQTAVLLRHLNALPTRRLQVSIIPTGMMLEHKFNFLEDI